MSLDELHAVHVADGLRELQGLDRARVLATSRAAVPVPAVLLRQLREQRVPELSAAVRNVREQFDVSDVPRGQQGRRLNAGLPVSAGLRVAVGERDGRVHEDRLFEPVLRFLQQRDGLLPLQGPAEPDLLTDTPLVRLPERLLPECDRELLG